MPGKALEWTHELEALYDRIEKLSYEIHRGGGPAEVTGSLDMALPHLERAAKRLMGIFTPKDPQL
jgi:hypothetical protein